MDPTPWGGPKPIELSQLGHVLGILGNASNRFHRGKKTMCNANHPNTTTWHSTGDMEKEIHLQIYKPSVVLGFQPLHFRAASGQCVWVFIISHMGGHANQNCNIIVIYTDGHCFKEEDQPKMCGKVCVFSVCVHLCRCVATISKSVFRGTCMLHTGICHLFFRVLDSFKTKSNVKCHRRLLLRIIH